MGKRRRLFRPRRNRAEKSSAMAEHLLVIEVHIDHAARAELYKQADCTSYSQQGENVYKAEM